MYVGRYACVMIFLQFSLILTAYDFGWVELPLQELTELLDVHPGLVDGPCILGGGGALLPSH